MIHGLGLDSVTIKRFNAWHGYSIKTLRRIFGHEELIYCLKIPTKSAERFAVRFAAKEALFKAFNQAYPESAWTLLAFMKLCQIISTDKGPYADIDWKKLNLPKLKVLISLTHTDTNASAVVLLQDFI